MKNNILQC